VSIYFGNIFESAGDSEWVQGFKDSGVQRFRVQPSRWPPATGSIIKMTFTLRQKIPNRKSQITNKFPMTKIQNAKPVWVIGY
jgi:hypothetical protein